MKLESKFNLNQTVYPIRRGTRSDWISCDTCMGDGNIIVKGSEKELSCPDCYGRKGGTESLPTTWGVQTDSIGKIGRIEIVEYAKKYHSQESKIGYMLDSTGVGSGTNWREDHVFASMNEAKKECDKRNNEKTTEL